MLNTQFRGENTAHHTEAPGVFMRQKREGEGPVPLLWFLGEWKAEARQADSVLVK